MQATLMPQLDTLPLFLRVGEIAELTGLSKQTVYKLVHSEGLPAVRFGERALRVHREAFVAWMEQRAVTQED